MGECVEMCVALGVATQLELDDGLLDGCASCSIMQNET